MVTNIFGNSVKRYSNLMKHIYGLLKKLEDKTCYYPKITISIVLFFLLLSSYIITENNPNSVFTGLFTEIIGIAITVFIIEWIINHPRKRLRKNARFEIQRIIFNFCSSLIDFKGFEKEYDDYYLNLIEKGIEDSFQESINKYIRIFNSIDDAEYYNKTLIFCESDIIKLGDMLSLNTKWINEIRRDYYLIFNDLERESFLLMSKSLDLMEQHIKIIGSNRPTGRINLQEIYRKYLSQNIKDYIKESISLLSKLK